MNYPVGLRVIAACLLVDLRVSIIGDGVGHSRGSRCVGILVVSRPGMRLRDSGLRLMYSLDTHLHLASALMLVR